MTLMYKVAATTPQTVERKAIGFIIAADVSPVVGPTVVNIAVLGSGGPKHFSPSPKSLREQLKKAGQERLLATRTASQGGLTYSHRLRQGLSFVGLLVRGSV